MSGVTKTFQHLVTFDLRYFEFVFIPAVCTLYNSNYRVCLYKKTEIIWQNIRSFRGDGRFIIKAAVGAIR